MPRIRILCADMDESSLHPAMRCAADDRQALEQLYRPNHAPSTSQGAPATNAAGLAVPKLKTPWHYETTHFVRAIA